jgi:hypothetical protein
MRTATFERFAQQAALEQVALAENSACAGYPLLWL